ncbi:MAG: helix-turn-helix transcriptional regulator [Spirochaetales bacterium]|nr:helix-turn-helix transcriptional regulator [Spirochaetales bacterium]
METTALIIEFFTYSLSLISLTLLLLVDKRRGDGSLRGLMAMIASLTALLVANLLEHLFPLAVFSTMKGLAAASMIFITPWFSLRMLGELYFNRFPQVPLLVYALMIALLLVVDALFWPISFLFFVLYASLGLSIVLTTSFILIVRHQRRHLSSPEKAESWEIQVCTVMAKLALFFMPLFLLFDFWRFVPSHLWFHDLVSSFSAAPLFLMIWNILLIYGGVKALVFENSSQSLSEILNRWESAYSLSPREREVCKLLLDGKSYKQIENALFISQATVKTHTNRIYQKTGAKNQVELIHWMMLAQKGENQPIS